MFELLSCDNALTVTNRIIESLMSRSLRAPLPGEPEERYVAAVLVPIVRDALAELRGLTLRGEGVQRTSPARFLGYSMYPDIAVMNYGQRVVAIEAKYVDFANAKGDLSTAVGQCAIYARAGYLAALGVLIGFHATDTESQILEENTRLSNDGPPWRLCSPRLEKSS